MPEPTAEHLHINRAEELRSATRVTARPAGAAGQRQALFFEGPQDIGKSSLLFEIFERQQVNGVYFVDLEEIPQEEGLLESLAMQARQQGVGVHSYRSIRDRFAEQSQAPHTHFTNVRVVKSSIQLLSESKERVWRMAALSDALLDSLVADARRPVVCLDSFETCAQPMRNWLGRVLLPNLLSRRELSVFVAGRQVPQLPHAFTHTVHTLALPPFDVGAVQEWIEALGLASLRHKATAIHQRHGGVPGLLEEFFRHHIEPAPAHPDSAGG